MRGTSGFSLIIVGIIIAIVCAGVAGAGLFIAKRNAAPSRLPLAQIPLAEKAPPQKHFALHQSEDADSVVVHHAESFATTTLIAVGDIMLGRSVETLMDTYGAQYPFEKIADALADADVAVGNLEGPINTDHLHTQNGSFTFSFASSTAKTLTENHFTILALGNNHAYNSGGSGFADTQRYLKNQSIVAVGHPYDADEKYTSTGIIRGRLFSFVSFNATAPSFSGKKAAALINKLKKEHADTFLVTLMHWGTEYSLNENDAQRTLAHMFIDAGADVIIGSHPHVVEGIELYNNKLIFYSLGNFIFDQYFSRKTQEELMLKMEVGDKEIRYNLIPLESVRSQPRIMEAQKAKEWLADLSSRSSPVLANQVLKGVMTVQR